MLSSSVTGRSLLLCAGLALGVASVVGGVAVLRRPTAASPVAVSAPVPVVAPPPLLKESRVVVKAGDNLMGFVARAQLEPEETQALVAALLKVRSPRSLRPGNALAVWRDASDHVVKVAFESSETDAIDFVPEGSAPQRRTFEAHQREVKLRTEVALVSVDIRSSLYDAFIDAHEDPQLAVEVSDILAWEMDFYRDVQPGDHLDVLVEKVTHDAKFVKYGNITAVRYAGHVGVKELYRYARASELSYFDEQGRSARRSFLKQPLPFVHITSRFGGRMHPILGYYKQHQGVDYGAPSGTPVWAVADGVVDWAGRKGGNGNLISVRHANGIVSHYAHLSGYGRGIRGGVHVVQKQVIGYVGATGMATGPHLHFALSRAHQFLNPLTQKFPAGEPIPEKERTAYFATIQPLKARLEQRQDIVTSRLPEETSGVERVFSPVRLSER